MKHTEEKTYEEVITNYCRTPKTFPQIKAHMKRQPQFKHWGEQSITERVEWLHRDGKIERISKGINHAVKYQTKGIKDMYGHKEIITDYCRTPKTFKQIKARLKRTARFSHYEDRFIKEAMQQLMDAGKLRSQATRNPRFYVPSPEYKNGMIYNSVSIDCANSQGLQAFTVNFNHNIWGGTYSIQGSHTGHSRWIDNTYDAESFDMAKKKALAWIKKHNLTIKISRTTVYRVDRIDENLVLREYKKIRRILNEYVEGKETSITDFDENEKPIQKPKKETKEMRQYTAIDNHGGSIVTVIAEDETEARNQIIEELDKNESRRAFWPAWDRAYNAVRFSSKELCSSCGEECSTISYKNDNGRVTMCETCGTEQTAPAPQAEGKTTETVIVHKEVKHTYDEPKVEEVATPTDSYNGIFDQIFAEMRKEIDDGKTVIDLSKVSDYRDIADKYMGQMYAKSNEEYWENRIQQARKVAKVMGMGGFWRGDNIALMLADMSMNEAHKLFA